MDYKKIEECGKRAKDAKDFLKSMSESDNFTITLREDNDHLDAMTFKYAGDFGDGFEIKKAITAYLNDRIAKETTVIISETQVI